MTGDDRPLIFLGVDIGKSARYAVGIDRDGRPFIQSLLRTKRVHCGC